MSVEIEYEAASHAFVVDEAVQLLLNRFPKVGEPPARENLEFKIFFSGSFYVVQFYTEGEANQFQFWLVELDTENAANQQAAHLWATEIANKFAPLYFGQPISRAKLEELAITLTYQ